jgi:hypothetical protein
LKKSLIEKVFKYRLFNININMEKKRGRHMNKKGAEMTIGTIIVIILALVVLVVIIYGFMTGWGNLWQKVTGISGGKADIDTHVQACQLACTTQSKNDYCKDRNVTLSDGKTKVSMKCAQIANDPRYGLDPCPSIDCDQGSVGSCVDLKGLWQRNACNSTQKPVAVTNLDGRGDNSYCCKVSCTDAGGHWSERVCDTSSEQELYLSLTDRQEGKGEKDVMCCMAKSK